MYSREKINNFVLTACILDADVVYSTERER